MHNSMNRTQKLSEDHLDNSEDQLEISEDQLEISEGQLENIGR